MPILDTLFTRRSNVSKKRLEICQTCEDNTTITTDEDVKATIA